MESESKILNFLFINLKFIPPSPASLPLITEYEKSKGWIPMIIVSISIKL